MHATLFISPGILSTDIVNAVLVQDSEIKCRFSGVYLHYCVVCCSTDPSVPPNSSLYNVSSTTSSDEVSVVLTGLTRGQLYYCKVAATDHSNASCFSPVYRNIQTLISISPGQELPGDCMCSACMCAADEQSC